MTRTLNLTRFLRDIERHSPRGWVRVDDHSEGGPGWTAASAADLNGDGRVQGDDEWTVYFRTVDAEEVGTEGDVRGQLTLSHPDTISALSETQALLRLRARWVTQLEETSSSRYRDDLPPGFRPAPGALGPVSAGVSPPNRPNWFGQVIDTIVEFFSLDFFFVGINLVTTETYDRDVIIGEQAESLWQRFSQAEKENLSKMYATGWDDPEQRKAYIEQLAEAFRTRFNYIETQEQALKDAEVVLEALRPRATAAVPEGWEAPASDGIDGARGAEEEGLPRDSTERAIDVAVRRSPEVLAAEAGVRRAVRQAQARLAQMGGAPDVAFEFDPLSRKVTVSGTIDIEDRTRVEIALADEFEAIVQAESKLEAKKREVELQLRTYLATWRATEHDLQAAKDRLLRARGFQRQLMRTYNNQLPNTRTIRRFELDAAKTEVKAAQRLFDSAERLEQDARKRVERLLPEGYAIDAITSTATESFKDTTDEEIEQWVAASPELKEARAALRRAGLRVQDVIASQRHLVRIRLSVDTAGAISSLANLIFSRLDRRGRYAAEQAARARAQELAALYYAAFERLAHKALGLRDILNTLEADISPLQEEIADYDRVIRRVLETQRGLDRASEVRRLANERRRAVIELARLRQRRAAKQAELEMLIGRPDDR